MIYTKDVENFINDEKRNSDKYGIKWLQMVYKFFPIKNRGCYYQGNGTQ